MVFQVIAGLAALISILMIAGILNMLINPHNPQKDFMKGIFVLILSGFIIVASFSVLYTVLLKSRFPDKYISKPFRIVFLVTGIISILFLFVCIAATATIIYDNMIRSEIHNSTELYVAIAMGCLCLIIIIGFICSLRLTKTIMQARRTSENAVIDSLGKISP